MHFNNISLDMPHKELIGAADAVKTVAPQNELVHTNELLSLEGRLLFAVPKSQFLLNVFHIMTDY